jgi:anti-sigma B factor antagonist
LVGKRKPGPAHSSRPTRLLGVPVETVSGYGDWPDAERAAIVARMAPVGGGERRDKPCVARVVGAGTWVLTVRGDLDLAGAKTLAAELEAVLAAGASMLVFDLTDSTYLDSTGVAVLARAAAELSRRDGAGALVGPSRHAVRVLSTTGLDRRFKLASTVEDALARVQPRRG